MEAVYCGVQWKRCCITYPFCSFFTHLIVQFLPPGFASGVILLAVVMGVLTTGESMRCFLRLEIRYLVWNLLIHMGSNLEPKLLHRTWTDLLWIHSRSIIRHFLFLLLSKSSHHLWGRQFKAGFTLSLHLLKSCLVFNSLSTCCHFITIMSSTAWPVKGVRLELFRSMLSFCNFKNSRGNFWAGKCQSFVAESMIFLHPLLHTGNVVTDG